MFSVSKILHCNKYSLLILPNNADIGVLYSDKNFGVMFSLDLNILNSPESKKWFFRNGSVYIVCKIF